MTKLEFANVMQVMAKLWPKQAKELNDEQINVWWMKIHHHGEADTISALRVHAANSKFWPKPTEIASALSQKVKAPDQEARSQTRWELQKQIWAIESPDRATEIMSWPDSYCEIVFSRWAFQKSAELYGPESGYTERHWTLFQIALKQENILEYEPHGRLEAEAIQRAYQSKKGIRNASTGSQAGRPGNSEAVQDGASVRESPDGHRDGPGVSVSINEERSPFHPDGESADDDQDPGLQVP